MRKLRQLGGGAQRSRGLYALATAAVIAATVTTAGVSWAQTSDAPEQISYQGTLFLASDGVTPVTGEQDIEFRLYRHETAPVAAAVWGERHEDIPVFNGVFNVYLGAGAAIADVPHEPLSGVFKTAPLWLAIRIGLDEEVAPRQKIASVPYAFTATNAGVTPNGVPAGTIVMFAGPSAPDGWLLCDGALYSKSAYPALFAAIGTAWGESGDSFQVPDLRGRLPVGAGWGAEANTVDTHGATAKLTLPPRGTGATTGQETETLLVADIPPHTHPYTDQYGSRSVANAVGAYDGADENAWDDTARTTAKTGKNLAHENVQPTTYVHYIIKY